MQRVKDKELIEWICPKCAVTFESDEYKEVIRDGQRRLSDTCPVCKEEMSIPLNS